RHFAQPALAEELGYVFVGGSNTWKVDEFQPCLLDWMIQALTSPSRTDTQPSPADTQPSRADTHPLLERLQAIGFQAIRQLLKNQTALRRCTAKQRRGFLGRLFGRRRATYEAIEALTKARDPEVFRLLDFTRFTDDVCSRFLAEPGNPVHRYALRVL